MRGKNLEVLATCASIESKYSTIKSPSLYIVELWGLKARAHFNLGNFKEVIRIAEEMLESEESKTDYGSAGIRMTNTLRIATSASFLRENYEALLRYSALINDPEDAVVKEVIMTATQSKVALAEGRYKRAFDFANIALKAARRHNITGVYASFDAAYVMSEYYRESGEYDLALEILNEFEPVAKAHRVWVWHIALIAKRALIYSSQNKINEALNILRSTREGYSGHEIDSEIFRILDEHELLIRVKLGDTERIGELLYRMPQTATTLAFSTAYAAMKNPSAAKSILSSYDVSNPRTELARELISAEVFKKDPSQALEHLQNAVAIAMSQGAKSVFLNQTSEVQDLLFRLANMQPTVYMEQLSAMIRKNQSDSLRDTMGLQEPLTKRELDILRRLSSGLPITKIAESLHISHNTIKTHLKSIYRKLAVESRKEAIERGVELFLF
jgi:ATP/maltotriose-dependent transcriptional regulator MalT